MLTIMFTSSETWKLHFLSGLLNERRFFNAYPLGNDFQMHPVHLKMQKPNVEYLFCVHN